MFLTRPLARRLFATALMLACGTSTVAGDALGDFTKTWNGRRVVVKSTLYTVLYDEVGRLGRHYRGKQAGLTVATRAGHYYEFDGPGSEEDIAEPTPDGVMSQMSLRFRANPLDIGSVKTFSALVMRQYDPGVTLIVDSVKMERNRIRFEFIQSDDDEDGFATSLTVEWPTPFSKALPEREDLEGVLRRFIAPL